MTLPWEQPVSPAEAMTPDTQTPAAAPPPMPVVATGPAGQRIGMDIAPQLHAAIQSAIDAAVAQHPVLGVAARRGQSRDHSGRTVAESSILDLVVAIAAALVTIISPTSPAVGVLWLAAAVLASRTLIQVALTRFVPQGAAP